MKHHISITRPLDLYHDSAGCTPSLGCQQCPEVELCGGLSVASGLYDCLGLCRCADADLCPFVCPRRPEGFVARVREVGGFDLQDTSRAPVVDPPRLPVHVPLIYHGSKRRRRLSVPAVSIPLAKLFNRRSGDFRYRDRDSLCLALMVSRDAKILLSGTDDDPVLERYWALAGRDHVGERLSDLGIDLVTTPNFTLGVNVPRWDDLYNMKRIATCWEELARGGVSAGLHLNARTDRDWERWYEFIDQRDEIRSLAFEFGTGAGMPSRISWYVEKLCELGATISRPLQLVVRGGLPVLPALRRAFSSLVFVDTTSFVKTFQRQEIRNPGIGRCGSAPSPTAPGRPLDGLLKRNVDTMHEIVAQRLMEDDVGQRSLF